MVSEKELQEHQAKIGGQRVTKDAVDANIKKIDYYIHRDTQLTICIVTLQNGFTVTGESACADPAMFDEKIGKRIARENAEKKIWPLMGYNLKQEMFLEGGTDFRDRLGKEFRELQDRVQKLEAFIKGQEHFKKLPEEDRKLLREQLALMTRYMDVLETRIKRVT